MGEPLIPRLVKRLELPQRVVNDNDVIDSLINFEGFLSKPTNIGDGKITIGSGLTDPKWIQQYRQKGEWTQEDNRRAVAEEVAKRRRLLEQDVPNWNRLPDEMQKAMLSYHYNYPFNRNNSPKMYQALEEGRFLDAIDQMDATSTDPKFQKGLQERREREQAWGRKGFNLKERPILYAPEGKLMLQMPKLKKRWQDLSVFKRAELIQAGIRNGITDLKQIKEKYNEFAEGGELEASEYPWTMEDESNYRAWRESLPPNLRYTNGNDYDMRRAYKAGMQPQWVEEDKSYHLASRDPQTGRYLKAPHHKTTLIALIEDAEQGYQSEVKDGALYTNVPNWAKIPGREYASGGNTRQPTQYIYDRLPQLLRSKGLNVRVTSGYRSPKANSKFSSGNKSWHLRHGAVDIVPQGKTTFEDIEHTLYNDPDIVNYMLNNGFGLLDESGRTEESRHTMKRTGATGPHFHIGKDSKPAARYAARMKGVDLSGLSSTPPAQPAQVVQPAMPQFTPEQLAMLRDPASVYNSAPVISEQPVIDAAAAQAQELENMQKAWEQENRQRGLNNFINVLGMFDANNQNPYLDTLAMLSNPGYPN